MNNEIQLADLNVYRQNPDILQDITYLKENLLSLVHGVLKFADFPENIRKNPFFALEYFSTIASDKKEYKHIPSELLKEQFFVSACLKLNPDIYLLADPSCHTEYAFMFIKKHHPGSYLKYAKEEDLNNRDFCNEALKVSFTNFRYLPEQFKKDKEIVEKQLVSVFSGDNFDRAKEIIKHLPNEVLEDRNFIMKIINLNTYSFEFLPEKYRADEEIAERAIRRNSKLFKYATPSLKENKEFVGKLLKFKDDCDRMGNFKALQIFNVRDILRELGESFLTREFCEKYSSEFRKVYVDMSKKVRGNLELIRCIYLYDSSKNTNTDLYDSRYINKIPNQELVDLIKGTMKKNSSTTFYKDIQPIMVKLIEAYALQKELKEKMPENEEKGKKFKL